MDTGTKIGEIREASPRFQARMAGVFALIGTTEGFAIWVRSRLVVDSDAAATAHNILAHELLYRWGFVGDVVSCVAFIVYTLLLYNLFRPVSRRLSLLAAVSNLIGEAIQLSIGVFLLAPLVVLNGARSLSAVNVAQSQAQALMFLDLYDYGYAISMVLFGLWNILTGYLIFRSTFLPRILGVLLAISGFYYQINNFAQFLSPAIAARVQPYVFVIGMAELLLALWLVVMGVNEQRWKEASAAGGI
ncbi:MAG TPA: DUF4386 domain-containing protein [Candidatus Angelobacter sp.]|nr:DUF4386 domain-containing protein [Candidatus Angelobacter sp.]